MPSWYLVCALPDAPACAGLDASDPVASAANATAAKMSAVRMTVVTIGVLLLLQYKIATSARLSIDLGQRLPKPHKELMPLVKSTEARAAAGALTQEQQRGALVRRVWQTVLS
jgi:hypothetical protein